MDRAIRPRLRAATWLALGFVLVATTLARGDELDEARTMRRHGIGLTIAGAAVDLAGLGLLLGSITQPTGALDFGASEGSGSQSHTGSAFVPLVAGSVVVGVLGGTILGVGIWHWKVGARQMKKLERATVAR